MSCTSDRNRQSHAVKNLVTEFLNTWSMGGDATLSLKCSNGKITMAFSSSHAPTSDSAPSSLPPGHPGPKKSQSLYHQQPPLQPRHRGLGDKARSRRRAARHQEKQQLNMLPKIISVPSGPVTATSLPLPTSQSPSHTLLPDSLLT